MIFFLKVKLQVRLNLILLFIVFNEKGSTPFHINFKITVENADIILPRWWHQVFPHTLSPEHRKFTFRFQIPNHYLTFIQASEKVNLISCLWYVNNQHEDLMLGIENLQLFPSPNDNVLKEWNALLQSRNYVKLLFLMTINSCFIYFTDSYWVCSEKHHKYVSLGTVPPWDLTCSFQVHSLM